jgi:hypothetical protein
MPTPTKQLLFTCVRIETTYADGSSGVGTSFVFQDAASPEGKQLFLVSNKHVVAKSIMGIVFFTEKSADNQPILGKPIHLQLDSFASQWHGHPDEAIDIAVMPLSWQLDLLAKGGKTPFIRPILANELADPSVFEGLDVSAPALFIGFPDGMFDEKHFLPIVRRGHVATSPDLDFNGSPIFLIDASVFPGSSGSPVFSVGDNLIGGTPALKWLGVISSVYTQSTDGRITWQPAPTRRVPIPSIDQMIDLGVVVKARCVRETISSFWRTR